MDKNQKNITEEFIKVDKNDHNAVIDMLCKFNQVDLDNLFENLMIAEVVRNYLSKNRREA